MLTLAPLDRIARSLATPPLAVAALLAAALLTGAGAAAAEEPTRAFMRCLEIQDDEARLSCYDRLAREVVELGVPGARSAAPAAAATAGAATAGETAASAGAIPEAAGSQAPEDAFGKPQKTPSDVLDSISANVVGGFTGWSGDTIFELDNGQVWKQTGMGRYEYSGKDRKVVIERALFGSFMLSPEGLNRSVRVQRVE